MKVLIQNKAIKSGLLQVPNMNYGQMQRWQEFVPLQYEIEMSLKLFTQAIAKYFATFRKNEIAESDAFDFPELKAFKNANWPTLKELVKENKEIFEDLIIYCEYDIMHLIVEHPVPSSNYYYSANSVDEVQIDCNVIKLKGTCFQSDYIEHSYNHELSRKYALLKTQANRK